MVTTALSASHGFDFKPPSKLGRPVPPPKHPIFSLRNCIRINCIAPTGNCQRAPLRGSQKGKGKREKGEGGTTLRQGRSGFSLLPCPLSLPRRVAPRSAARRSEP